MRTRKRPKTSAAPVAAPVGLSTAVKEKLAEAYHRVRHPAAARFLWDKRLTPAERGALGGDFAVAYQAHQNAVGMWRKLHDVSPMRAVITLAHTTDQLSEGDFRWLDGEISSIDPQLPPSKRQSRPRSRQADPDDQLQKALSSHALVLVRGTEDRRLYWNGHRFGGNWGRFAMSWELLEQLVVNARLHQCVRWDNLTRASKETVVKHRRSKLKTKLPPELDDLIKPDGPHAYRLHLPASDIRVIELKPGDWLVS